MASNSTSSLAFNGYFSFLWSEWKSRIRNNLCLGVLECRYILKAPVLQVKILAWVVVLFCWADNLTVWSLRALFLENDFLFEPFRSKTTFREVALLQRFYFSRSTCICHEGLILSVIFAYEQALLCLGYYPDIWYEASLFQQKAATALAEKGDVKTANAMYSEISR